MKRLKHILVFVAIILVIGILSGIAAMGADLVFVKIPSVQSGIKLGLDLRGGSIITLEAAEDQINPDTLANDIEVAKTLIERRLTASGYTEAMVYKVSSNRIRIEIPDVEDPEEAVALVGKTAKLEFRDYTGKVWLNGDAVESAKAEYSPVDNTGISKHHVVLSFKQEYRDAWADATKFAASQSDGSNYIAIYMDETEQSAPRVGSEYASTGLTGDSCVVTFGDGTNKELQQRAAEFANLVQIGRLPFDLKQVELRSVGPTLGERSLETSILAGAIGLILVILFMIIFYRVPGLVSGISLIFYTALMLVVLAVLRVNLSLPGIAGIILSIGMAVDANVIIFERIKEELRSGKTIASAVASGYKRALTAIIDSNITTIIAAVVLLIFGTGAITGFAITLLTGVLLSMFTVLVVSRLLLNQLVMMGLKSLRLFGVNTEKKPFVGEGTFSFVKKFNMFGIIAIVLVATGLIGLVLLPFGVGMYNFDIDFVGGTTFHIDMGVQLDRAKLDDIAGVVEKASGVKPSAPQITGTGGTEVIIKMTSIDSPTREAVFNALKQEYGLSDSARLNVEDVGATVGRSLQQSAILSVTVAALLILLYITIRFQFSSGLAAVICLIQDLLVMLSAYVIFRIPINMNFIAAMLTILGYSINANIIVFDRVRENRKLMLKKPFGEIVDRSIHQTLGRSINTTVTTLIPLVLIIIIGVTSIREFAIPLMVGIVSGLYSSVCLAGGMWAKFIKGDVKLK